MAVITFALRCIALTFRLYNGTKWALVGHKKVTCPPALMSTQQFLMVPKSLYLVAL